MNRKQKIKLLAIVTIIIALGLATALVLFALKQNINLFYTPTQLFAATVKPDQNLRVGGFVQKNSVHYDTAGTGVTFTITDQTHQLNIVFHGVLPNLFREGQGIVVTGKLDKTNILQASEVFAKHDEKYMPPPLAKALQSQSKREML